MFYKVAMNTELVNTEPMFLQKYKHTHVPFTSITILNAKMTFPDRFYFAKDKVRLRSVKWLHNHVLE